MITYTISIIDKQGKYYTITINKPEVTILQKAHLMMAEERLIEAGQMIIVQCNDGKGEIEAVMQNEDLFIAAGLQAVQAVQILNGQIKKN